MPNEAIYRVPFFNPGGNVDQISLLRLVNAGEEPATVTIHGTDDTGQTGGPVRLALGGGEARTVTAGELEAGIGVDGNLGEGVGKWRLTVASERPVRVLSLLDSATGRLSNLSTMPVEQEPRTAERAETSDAGRLRSVLFLPAANDIHGRQGVVRVINRGDVDGTVTIKARDESEWDYEPIELRVAAGKAVNFNSDDLEQGNDVKGLSNGVGAGVGTWRLDLTSTLDIDVLSYIRTDDGFLSAMHDVVQGGVNGDAVPIFNPGHNVNQVSSLYLVNPGEQAAQVTITGIDDSGTPGGKVYLSVPGGTTRTVTAQELESGGVGLDGNLGDGAGKWRLVVESDSLVRVLNLLESPAGHLSNLSTVPE